MAKARVQKRLYYKIGEACKALDIQPYVLRYWETEFPALTPSKSRSGQRVYSEKELAIIRRIKELLYGEGYTIAGAKKKLETELANGTLERDDDAPAEPSSPAEPPVRTVAMAIEEAAEEEAAEEAESELEPAQQSLLLDTQASERIQLLRRGVRQALQEAREILALLEGRSPSAN